MRGGGSGAAHVSCGFVRMDDELWARGNLRRGQISSAEWKIAPHALRDTMFVGARERRPLEARGTAIHPHPGSIGRSVGSCRDPSIHARPCGPPPTDRRASELRREAETAEEAAAEEEELLLGCISAHAACGRLQPAKIYISRWLSTLSCFV